MPFHGILLSLPSCSSARMTLRICVFSFMTSKALNAMHSRYDVNAAVWIVFKEAADFMASDSVPSSTPNRFAIFFAEASTLRI